MECTAPGVTAATGELLPHLFTLPLALKPGRLFSVTPAYPCGYLSVRKHGALRCPDFPSPALWPGTMERPAALQIYSIARKDYKLLLLLPGPTLPEEVSPEIRRFPADNAEARCRI